jgi:hypothetical protein
MNSYDLDIRHYNEEELCKFLRIEDSLDTLSTSSVIKYAQNFKRGIMSKGLKDNETQTFLVFLENAKQKLLSYIERRPPVQVPPTNYDIIQSQNQLSGANHAVTTDKIVPVVNTFINPFPDGVINPLEKRYFTKVISVDSLFRTNYSSTDSSNFYWTLHQPEHKVVSMKLVSVELPVMWYDISDKLGNNVFQIRLFNIKNAVDISHTITLPPGHYGHIDFSDALSNLFLNIGGGLEHLIAVVNDMTSKTTIRARHPDDSGGVPPYVQSSAKYSPTFYFELVFDINTAQEDVCRAKDVDLLFRKSLGWYMGFRKIHYTVRRTDKYIDLITEPNGQIVYEGYVCSESSFGSGKGHYLYIAVDDFNKNTLTQTISSNIGDVFIGNDILGRISIEDSSNEIMINQSDKIFRQRDYLGPVTLRKMKFRLLNRFGDTIDTNNNDFSMALELKVLY